MTKDECNKETNPPETESNNLGLWVAESSYPLSVQRPQFLAVPSLLYPNPVLAAADPLLRKMASMTKGTASSSMQEELNQEVKNFEKTLRQWRYPNDRIVLSSHILQTYIQLFVRQFGGGYEEFRTIQAHPLLAHLEKLAKKAHQYIDILELLYLCLSLDLQPQEKEDKAWQTVLKKIYQFIYAERGEMERKLSIDIVPPQALHTLRSLVLSFLKMMGIAIVVLLGMYGASFYLLHIYSDHFSHELEVIDQNLEGIK